MATVAGTGWSDQSGRPELHDGEINVEMRMISRNSFHSFKRSRATEGHQV